MPNDRQVEPDQETELEQEYTYIPYTSNQSFLWDGMDLHFPDVSKSTNPQPDSSETFQIDSFLEDNNRFLAEANELLKHYDEQVIREREKVIREIKGKCKNKDLNKTARPAAYSLFEKECRNQGKSEKENMERRNEILNKQSANLRNRRKDVHLNSDTDDSEALELEENFNQDRTRRATIRNRPTRRSGVDRIERETEDESELNENIGNYPRKTTHFPFGMTHTPFQVMSNWPLKIRNNKEDSPAHFWTT